MKKLRNILIVACLILSFSIYVYAGNIHTSGKKTTDDTITTGTGKLKAVLIYTDGSNNGRAIIYDNTTTSGTVLRDYTIIGVDRYGGENWGGSYIPYYNGISIDISDSSGGGTGYFIDWEPN